jgi:hypothetical protein
MLLPSLFFPAKRLSNLLEIVTVVKPSFSEYLSKNSSIALVWAFNNVTMQRAVLKRINFFISGDW